MRILLSIHHVLDRNAGAPGVTIQLAEAFRKLGHHADILSLTQMGIKHESIRNQLLFPAFLARQRRRLFDSYDVLDLSSGDGWLLESLPRPPGTAIVARSHGLEHLVHEQRLADRKAGTLNLSWKYPIYHGGWRLMEVARSFARADAAFFLNSVERAYAIEHLGVRESNAFVVDNGIADSFLSRPFVADPGPGLRIAVVGTYIERKIHKLPALLNRLLPRHPDWSVRFLGTRVEAERVLADFSADVRPRIEVIPAYENVRLPELISGSHLLLFPSLFEGSPLVPFEAMACGLAVVASALPGIRERVREGDGVMLVPPGDMDALASALDTLAADRSRLDSMRRNGYRRAQDFSWLRIAEHTLKLYADALERRQA